MIIRAKQHQAFTLIELLVALAVFGIMAALSYGALSQTLAAADILSDRMDRLQALQRTMRILTQDFVQLAPRPVRDELGDSYRPALQTDTQSGFALQLTHGGWNNPMGLPRGTLQRAAYRLQDGELIRYHWIVLDRTLSTVPIEVVLLDGIENIVFRFMQDDGEWSLQWPALNTPGTAGLRQRPRAIEVILSLEGEGELTRLIEVAM